MAYIGNTATTQAFTPAVDYFNGNGSTVAFTLSKPVASVAQVQAVIENVPQNPGSAYTVSGNTITFTSAPPSGTSNIYVYYTSPITQVIAPSQGTVGSSQLQSDLTIEFADGSASAPSITNTGDTNTGIYFPAADNIAFTTNGTIRGRWTTDGLCFNSDTAAANALDDYEEGTWTPTLTADTTAPTVTYTSQIGSYRKIGSQVIVEFNLAYSGRSGGSGTAWVGGLPFQAFSHSPDSRAFEAIAVWGGPSFTGVIFGIVGGSSTNIIMYYILSGNANAQDISSMSTSGSIRGVFSYITS